MQDRKLGAKKTKVVRSNIQSHYNIRLFQTCNIFSYVVNVGKHFTLYSAEAYSEPYEPSKM